MKKNFLLIILSFFTCLSFAQTRNFKLVKTPTENPTTQKRKAVVIGMSDYGAGRSLNNTLNDANDMANAFTKLGFEVTLLENNDLRTLRTNLTNWYNSIEGNDMAIFYFAGHGMEVAGENYLIPVDAELSSQADVQYNALNVNQVLDNMDIKRVGMKLLILDACRDNPFTRSWSRGSEEKGLAQMAAPKGTFIAFAAAPGKTAQDGGTYNLPNGVFTYYLKQEILKEGVSIDNIFINVSDAVSNLTNEGQIPFRNTSLTKRFYFIPQGNDNPNPSPAPVVKPSVDVEELMRQADAYYNNKQYSDAFPLYKQAAEQGNVVAQKNLGRCYDGGWGVTKDLTQAVYWYKKAADQGYANAQNSLGLCYEHGNGVIKDYNQAMYWYKKAADQGYADAQNNLGLCYEYGNGVTKDYNQAIYWYKKAADQGFAIAQSNFGNCYYNGWGVTQDYNQAVYWYKKAAEQGFARAQSRLGNCYYNGNGVTKDYNQAIYWYKQAAEQGETYAQNMLGFCYERGNGLAKDITQAVYWYKKAADQGNATAQCNLGHCYYNGWGVTKDLTQAVYWYKKAADQGNANAQNMLGECYYYGRGGVTQDYNQAVYWYRKSADQDSANAQNNLGYCYENGYGLTKDISQAVYWYKKAADQDSEYAKDALKRLKVKYP